jgi:hypothetical protein
MMHSMVRWSMTAAFLVLSATSFLGCGDGDGDESAPPPIPSKPLSGTLAGKPFTAKAALAKKSVGGDPDEKAVSIYDVDATCDKSPNVDRFILTTVVWQIGAKQGFLNTSFNDFGQTPGVIGIADDSQLEVVSAPTEAGARGKIRLRARYEQDSVEGEIEPIICP